MKNYKNQSKKIWSYVLAAAIAFTALSGAVLAEETLPQTNEQAANQVQDSGVQQNEETPCKNIEESNLLLDQLLEFLKDRQTMRNEQGTINSKSDELEALSKKIDDQYAHVEACKICTEQMAPGGAYNAKFHPVQTMELVVGEGYSYDPGTKTLTITTNDGSTAWRSDTNIPAETVFSTNSNHNIYRDVIQSVIIKEPVTILNSYAFAYCEELTSVIIPDSVTEIESYAFQRCEKLAAIKLPQQLTTIGWEAFSDCKAFSEVTIPDSVTNMDANVFLGCDSLKFITLSKNLTKIGHCNFYGCKALTSITIPDKVTLIDYNAFSGCTKLEAVTMKRTTPPTLSDQGEVFKGHPQNFKIMVPPRSLDAYKAAAGWITYKDYIFAFSPSVSIGEPTGVLTYGNAGSATYEVKGSTFGGDYPAFDPTVQWKSGESWSTAAPEGLIGTLTGSGDSRTFTVTTTAAANAGEYEFKVVSGGVESIAKVQISKAEAKVGPGSYNMSTGGTLPKFELQYTGLVNGDSSTPSTAATFSCRKDGADVDGKTAGTYEVLWSNMDAVKFSGMENYNVTKKKEGTLSVTTPSSGGGGGGGGSSTITSTLVSGGGSSLKAPSTAVTSKNVIDNPVGSKGTTQPITDAVKNAVASGLTNTSTSVSFANYAALTVDGVKAINDAVAKAVAEKNVNLDLGVNFDQKAGNAVVSRISVNPVELAKVMTNTLKLGVSIDQKNAQVTQVNSHFAKYFTNKIVSIVYNEKKPLGVSAEIAAKLDLAKTFENTSQYYFYSYDNVTNAYTLITTPNYFVDANGYTHVTAPLGGSVIITDAPLTGK